MKIQLGHAMKKFAGLIVQCARIEALSTRLPKSILSQVQGVWCARGPGGVKLRVGPHADKPRERPKDRLSPTANKAAVVNDRHFYRGGKRSGKT